MSWQAKEVPLDYLHRVWPEIEHYIQNSVEHSDGDVSLDETKIYVMQGTWVLIVAVDESNKIYGAATVTFYNRTNHRVAFVTNIGGKMLANLDTFSQFCDILRSHGATCIEGSVRDSLMRLWARLGARKKANSIQIPL